jgi:hypothetical protein
MSGFIQGQARAQSTLFPQMLDDFVVEDSAVRVTEVMVRLRRSTGGRILGHQVHQTCSRDIDF